MEKYDECSILCTIWLNILNSRSLKIDAKQMKRIQSTLNLFYINQKLHPYKIWIVAAAIYHVIIDIAYVHDSMIGSIMNSGCVWNIGFDVAIVGIVIGVRFAETPSWMKQPLESWPGPRFVISFSKSVQSLRVIFLLR